MKEFRVILKQLRTKAGITQEDVARRSGLSLSTIHKLEQKESDPSWSTIQKLAKALGVGVDAFLATDEGPGDKPVKKGRKGT